MSQFFYAVGRGRKVGVYSSWAECLQQVENLSNAKYKKFKTYKEAADFVEECKMKYSPSKVPLSQNPMSSKLATLRSFDNPASQPSVSVTQPSTGLSLDHSCAVSSHVITPVYPAKPLPVRSSQQLTKRPHSELMTKSQKPNRINVVAPVSMQPNANEIMSPERLSPRTLEAIECLTQQEPFVDEIPMANSKDTTVVSGNNNDIFDVQKFVKSIDTRFSEIKNTLDLMFLKISDLDNKVESISSQLEGSKKEPVKNICGSSTKRALFDGYDVPQPVGSRNLCTASPGSDIEIVPVPPKKIPKIELNSDDEGDGISHDFKVDENGYVIVYTDGACENNGRRGAKAGIGVWFGDCHPLNCSEPVHGRPTNNTAEIQAAVQALEVAKRAGVKRINVHTDSEFTINCITKWVKKWIKNDWKVASGANVKNKEDLITLLDAMEGIDVKWQHVRGHRGIHGNEMADRLARSGAERYKP